LRAWVEKENYLVEHVKRHTHHSIVVSIPINVSESNPRDFAAKIDVFEGIVSMVPCNLFKNRRGWASLVP
jgi:hypothetical protein